MPRKRTPSQKPVAPKKKSSKPKNGRKKTRSKKPIGQKSLLRCLCRYGFMGLIWGCFTFGLLLIWLWYDLPPLEYLQQGTRPPGISILDRHKRMVATYGDIYGSFIDLKKVPAYVPQAIIAIEDRRFYTHFGIDIVGVLRAALKNYRAGRVVQGGSTLTQQLAKNFLLSEALYKSNNRSFKRKLQEIFLAFILEKKFTKQQIFSIYLNRIYLGSGVFGINAAAQKLFGKRPQHLTLYESAVIAGLLKAPSHYLKYPQKAHERALTVLNQMAKEGFIQKNQIKPHLKPPKILFKGKGKSRYFTDWIISTLPDLIGPIKEDIVVYTTLDPFLQLKAEETIKTVTQTTLDKTPPQGALISMTPEGAVVALVGGRDYWKSPFNRATQSERQSGSAFKLFPYLCAFEQGDTPQTRVQDGPLRLGKWRPKNYYWTPKGSITYTDAFAFSVNTAAVRIAKKVGLTSLHKMATRLGITSPLKKDFTVALGSSALKLIDLTGAYATVANGGYGVFPHGVTEIRNRQGKLLYKRKPGARKRVISQKTTLSMRSLLRAVMHYGTGKRSQILGQITYGKSGTGQNYRNAVFVGFSDHPSLVTGVWMGHDNRTPMTKVTGGKQPAACWKKFMTAAQKQHLKK